MNRVLRKEIVKDNDRQKIMLINVDDMDVVILIHIVTIMVTGHITETITILQELFMEML